jgi:hypothetical protein
LLGWCPELSVPLSVTLGHVASMGLARPEQTCPASCDAQLCVYCTVAPNILEIVYLVREHSSDLPNLTIRSRQLRRVDDVTVIIPHLRVGCAAPYYSYSLLSHTSPFLPSFPSITSCSTRRISTPPILLSHYITDPVGLFTFF